ncbi:MAG: DNA translocase FtsK 4TM domain-containing protein [Bacteroidales bacterium]|nr:DNA translocase FtsK 4TM domain-containing protein [Bacteroidales bacterium]MBR5907014.1 DNA translocase FtsK 4TM domain-containing protein [Bacteroidales bacterium]
MAKSKKKQKEEDQIIAEQEMAAPEKREGLYLICGLVALAIAVYTLIALISYVFTWAHDQSSFAGNEIFNSITTVENGGGKIGLWWANLLISKLFGLGAFIIPFFFFGVALVCLKIKKVRLLRLFFITIFGCILISVFFSFIFSFTRFDRWFGSGAGGSYGYYVNQFLKTMIGSAGTGAILIIAIIGWCIIINKSLIRKISGGITAVGNKVMEVGKGSELEGDLEGEELDGDVDENGDLDTEEEEDLNFDDEPNQKLDPAISVVDENAPDESAEGADAEAAAGALDPEITAAGADVALEVKDVEGEGNELLGEYTEEELQKTFDPRLELSHYEAPTLDLLESYKDKWYEVSRDEMERNKNKIVHTLGNYKIGVTKVSAVKGPTVTLYEVVPAPGIRVSQIKRLEEDIQLSLAAKGVRVVTLPGTNSVGIEVANDRPSVVSMQSCLEYLQTKMKEPGSKESGYALPIAIGKTISNEVFTFDLAKTPHLLIAGATGQGKSVGLNALVSSILYTKHPSEVKFVLVDPKRVELSLYSRLSKHFLACLPDTEDKEQPVITDTAKVVRTLKSLCVEMDNRYKLLESARVRNIKEYNEKFLERKLNPGKGHRFLPYIVLIIDEYADLMITAGKDAEIPITRLAQLARAIGIHLVIATQRPTTTVITGNIKANFPARIAFYVRSSIDSRTILDESGANQLIGRGDMLYATGSEVTRVQCALIETKEIDRIVEFISSQVGYSTALYLPEPPEEDEGSADVPFKVAIGETNLARRDEFFDDAARLIVAAGSGSASFIQRKMNLGYNRASKLIDQLEKAGIVGPADGAKPRQALIPDLLSLDDKLEEIKQQFGK